MQAPKISIPTQKAQTANLDLSVRRLGNPNGGEDFSQVLNLISPKSNESMTQPKAEVKNEDRNESRISEKRDTSVSRSETEARAKETDDQRDPLTESRDVQVNPAVAQLAQASEAAQHAKSLRLMAQFSQEDLLKLVEWQKGQVSEGNPLETNLNLERFPQLKGFSSGDLMALLNGFKHLQQPEHAQEGHLQSPQFQWAEAQALQAQNSAASALTQSNLQNLAQQQLQAPQLQNVQMVPLVDAMARPQQVMPTLNLIRLTQAQQEGVVRQVAHSFKTQASGTQTAEIRLHPAELGLVRLKVEMQGADVRIFFSAEQPVVNDLLTQHIDQLKGLLLEQDLNLAEAGLFQDQLPDQQAQEDNEGEDYGSDERPDLLHRPKKGPRLSPLPNRFRATV
jgi:flagellar hook-length control protein FliK